MRCDERREYLSLPQGPETPLVVGRQKSSSASRPFKETIGIDIRAVNGRRGRAITIAERNGLEAWTSGASSANEESDTAPWRQAKG